MSKNIIPSTDCGIVKNNLTKNQQFPHYKNINAKNIEQNLPSEKFKMHSRILRGFFYARNILNCATMMDCVEEPSGSPRSLNCGKANSAQSVTLQFALKLTVSKLFKETIMSINTPSGIPSSIRTSSEYPTLNFEKLAPLRRSFAHFLNNTRYSSGVILCK